MPDIIVKATNVSKRYTSFRYDLLRDINFSVLDHSFQFLTGPSGSGKSTLLRLINRTLLPTDGSLEIFGTNTADLTGEPLYRLRRRIGVVAQDFRLIDHLTVYQNVELPFRVVGREESDYRKEVIDLLKWVGLGEHLNSLPRILSSGEKQRAAIARAVISRPHLLLADEPTANLDPTLGRRILRLFIELNKAGTAIIVATHDVSLMDQYEAKRIVIHQGRLYICE
jgi:cell division transport system ATP-binding protein